MQTRDVAHDVEPEPETARLLALTALQVENDPAAFNARLATMKRFDPSVGDDAVLGFYGALFPAREEDESAGLERALELWKTRAEIGLAAPEHGRALAQRLFYAGRREPALAVLDDSRELAHSALELDVLEAMACLMRSTPAKPRRVESAPPPEKPAADDAPAKKPAGGKPGAQADGKGAGKGQASKQTTTGAAPAGAKKTGAKTTESASPGNQPGAPGKDKGQNAPPRTKTKKKPK